MTCSTAIYEKVVREVLPEVPGAAPKHVEQVTHRVVKEFLRRSLVWQEKLTPQLRSNKEIVLTSPNGEVVWALQIMYEGRLMRRGNGIGMLNVANYEPVNANTFLIHNVDIDKFERGDIEVTVALQPNDSGKAPEFIYRNYLEALRTGVTGYLFGEPFKPYMTPDHSATYLALYRKYTAEAKDEAIRGFTKGEAPWMYPGGFA